MRRNLTSCRLRKKCIDCSSICFHHQNWPCFERMYDLLSKLICGLSISPNADRSKLYKKLEKGFFHIGVLLNFWQLHHSLRFNMRTIYIRVRRFFYFRSKFLIIEIKIHGMKISTLCIFIKKIRVFE